MQSWGVGVLGPITPPLNYSNNTIFEALCASERRWVH